MSQVSYRHYTALFRDRMGGAVNSYLTRLRIEYAKKRLSETGNILFSSLESGFADLSHFFAAVRKLGA
jgi:AraC-like DNA-binding protein